MGHRGFEPCSPLVASVYPSPNCEERRDGALPRLIVLHYTGMRSARRAIIRLAAPRAKVSAHYVIDENGRITQMVPERLRAWHAGVAHWRGFTDVNSSSIGIEIQNPGHDGGYPEFPTEQIEAVTALCQDIRSRHDIRPQHVLAHSDVAPRRKIDPGEKFPWAYLARSGVGHWVKPQEPGEGAVLSLGSAGIGVMRLQRQFRAYGYGIEATGVFDEHNLLVVEAFQRHFRPSLVDGRADPSTCETLDRLLAALPHA